MTVGTGQQERSTTKEPATEDHQSQRLEGIIAKRAASTYQPRRRSPDRLKINARLKKKFVIGDITEGKESRKQIGALLLGVYE